MQTIEGFDFFHLAFDQDGALQAAAEFDADEAARQQRRRRPTSSSSPTAFATTSRTRPLLYTDFLKTFRAHCARPEFQAALGGRRFVVAGVFWPSKAFREALPAGGRRRRRAGARRRCHRARADQAAARGPARSRCADRRTVRRSIRPSRCCPTLENNPDAQDEFVALVLSLLDGSPLDDTEGLAAGPRASRDRSCSTSSARRSSFPPPATTTTRAG